MPCHDPEAVADQVFADLELDRDSVRNITLTLSSRVIRACGEIDCKSLMNSAREAVTANSRLHDLFNSAASMTP